MSEDSEVEQVNKTFLLLASLTPAGNQNEASTSQKHSFTERIQQFDELVEQGQHEAIRIFINHGLKLFGTENDRDDDVDIFWNGAVRIAACFSRLLDLYELLRKRHSQLTCDGNCSNEVESELISVRDAMTLKCACETLTVFGIAANLEIPFSCLHLAKRLSVFDALSPSLAAYREKTSQAARYARCTYLVSALQLLTLVDCTIPSVPHAALLNSAQMDCMALLFQLARFGALRRKREAQSSMDSDSDLANRFVDRFKPVRDLVLLQTVSQTRNEAASSSITSATVHGCGWLRAICAFHIGRLTMSSGGLKSVIFAILTECLGVESAEVWRTDASKFESVALLLSHAPPFIDATRYFISLSSQFADADASASVLTPVYTRVVHALLNTDQQVAFAHFLNPLLAPLHRICNQRIDDGIELELVNEAELCWALSRLRAIFVQHADPRSACKVVHCLRNVLHVLFIAFSRVRRAATSLKSTLRDLLLVTLRHAEPSDDLIFQMLLGSSVKHVATEAASTDGAQVTEALHLHSSLLFDECVEFEHGDSGGVRVLLHAKSTSETSVSLRGLLNTVSAMRLDIASKAPSDADADADAEECGVQLDARVADIRDALIDLVRSVNRSEKCYAVSVFFHLLHRWTTLASVSPLRDASEESCEADQVRRLLSVVTATLEALVGDLEPAALADAERKDALLGFAADFLDGHCSTLSTLATRLDHNGIDLEDAEAARTRLASHLRTTQLALVVAFALLPDREQDTHTNDAESEQRVWSQLATRLLPAVERLGALLVRGGALTGLGQACCDASRLCSALRAALLTHAVVLNRGASSVGTQLPSADCDSEEESPAFDAIRLSGVRNAAFDYNDASLVRDAFFTLVNALEAGSHSDVVPRGALLAELRGLLRRVGSLGDAQVIAAVRTAITQRRSQMLTAITSSLTHSDTFVYLAAVELLAAVVTVDDCFETRSVGANALRTLATEFVRLASEADCPAERLSLVITLSEALQRSMRAIGELVTCYRDQLAHAFLVGAKHGDELVRASCVAAVAQLCTLLGRDAAPLATELCAAADAIIRSDPYPEVRRAAVLLFAALVHHAATMHTSAATLARDVYRALRDATENDADEMVRGHASVALRDVDELARRLLIGESDDSRHPKKRIFVLDAPPNC